MKTRLNLFFALCSLTLLYSCGTLFVPRKAGQLVKSKEKASATTEKAPATTEKAVDNTPSSDENVMVDKPLVARTITFSSTGYSLNKVVVGDCVLKDSTTLAAHSVVVGSFTQPASALPLIDKLKQKSITPFFVLNQKGMYRLVVGTFANKEEADYLVLKLDVSDIEAWILSR